VSYPSYDLTIPQLIRRAHEAAYAAGWWHDFTTGEYLLMHNRFAPYVIATKIMLTVSELSEGMEGVRKDAMDDKLPHRKMIEVELADAMIRIADLAGALNLDLEGAILEKLKFNTVRPDHQGVTRRAPGGKKF